MAPAEIGHAERLGGIGERVARPAAAHRQEARAVVLGHLLRGGSPTASTALASMRFGAAAVRALDEGPFGRDGVFVIPNVNYIALEEVAGRMKCVPLDGDTLQTARDLGICLGIRPVQMGCLRTLYTRGFPKSIFE